LASYYGREKELLKTLSEKHNAGFNDLIISMSHKVSLGKDQPGAPEKINPVFPMSTPAENEMQTKKGSKNMLIGVVSVAGIVVIIVALYFSGVFKSGTKADLNSSDLASSQSNSISPGTSGNTGNDNSGNRAPTGNKEESDETRAYSTLQSYYADLMNRNFDATKYFADKVDRFITMRNVTPQVINSYINSSYYKEFVNAKSEIEQEPFVVTKESQDRYSVEYIENGTCYRTSLKKYQHSRVNVKVLLTSEFKIVFFHQYKLIENDYSDTPQQLTSDNTSQPKADQTETQNNSGSFYIISSAAVKTENQAKAKASELRNNGNSTGYLWIPDYASLSGAKFYCVYIGPFYTQHDCEIATEEYRKLHPDAYGLLVSQDRKRVQINGIDKVVVTQK
jgi:hypothetical protein